MKISFHAIQNCLLAPFNEQKLIENIRKISKNFTSNRDQIHQYVDDVELVSTYALFYLLTNIPKLFFTFDNLSEPLKKQISNSTILDIGTGPGTFVFSLIEYFSNEYENLKLIGFDRSKMMIDQAKMILKTVYPEQKSVNFSTQLPSEVIGPVTLIWGHSLNEMGLDTFKKLIKQYSPEHIVVIEAGTPEQFKKVLQAREFLISLDYNVEYPCVNNNACPISLDNWCHQRISYNHEFELGRIIQKVHSDRFSMPLIAQVYSKKLSDLNRVEDLNGMAIVVSVVKELKHAFACDICIQDNSLQLKLIRAEVMKSSLERDLLKKLKRKESGQKIKYSVRKIITEYLWQIDIE